MSPKQASKESEVAEAIEQWELKVNRSARHGDEYRLTETYKKIALKQILVGRTLQHFELNNLEKNYARDVIHGYWATLAVCGAIVQEDIGKRPWITGGQVCTLQARGTFSYGTLNIGSSFLLERSVQKNAV